MAALQVRKAQSLDYDADLIDFHLKMFTGFMKDGNAQKRDFQTAMERGSGLPPSGSPELDAARVNMVTQTALDGDFDEETKANVLRSALETEKQLSRPGEYLAPSRAFYTEPARAKELRQNPRAKQEMTQTLDNDAPGIINAVKNTEDLQSLTFAPQMEREGREPWLAYESGGPWSSSLIPPRTNNKLGGTFLGSMVRGVGDMSGIVAALNNDYWVYRNMHGAAAAEQHVDQIMELINGRTAEESEESGEIPTFDLTD
jgi:hypothetical protein